MTSGVFQRSFAGGELSESVAARADVIKRGIGARTGFNGFASRSGAFVNRAGTKFVATVKDYTHAVDPDEVENEVPENLIPFIFNSEQAYVLLFGHEYIRLYRFGEPVLLGPLGAWSAATAYTQGDTVTYSGTDYYATQDSTNEQPDTATDFWYALPTPAANYNGNATSILEIPTPYQAGEIRKQNTGQSADVLSIAHRNHAPRELQRLSALKWRLVEIAFQPDIASPGGMVALVNGTASIGSGPKSYRYTVTAVSKDTLEESVIGHVDGSATSPIDSAGDADITLTEVGHGLETGDRVYVSVVTPSSDVNTVLVATLQGSAFFVTRQTDDIFTLDDTSGIPYSFAHTATWHLTRTLCHNLNVLGPSRYNTITWTDVPDALEYVIYKNSGQIDPGVYGYLTTTKKAQFRDDGIEPDFERGPPHYVTRFERAERHPHLVNYFQQRLVYAQSVRNPRSAWLSGSAAFHNFMASSPPKDNDAISLELSGQQANEIRQIVGLDQLLFLTLGNQQAVRGSAEGVLTPETTSPRVQGYNGANNVRPVVIGSDAIFVQARGSVVRSLAFDDIQQTFAGGDLTIFASHMIDGRDIFDMDYAQVPHSIVWAVRSDGVFLSLTYIREHEIVAWTRNATYTLGEVQSNVLSVAVIPEDGVDIAYMVVERVIDGAAVRYVEKMVRRCTTWEDA